MTMEKEDIKKAVEEGVTKAMQESVVESIRKSVPPEGEVVPVGVAAKEWATRYCMFAGFKREDAEKIVKEGKLKEKCAEKVREEYLKAAGVWE